MIIAADFERGLTVERTKASLSAKRRRGEPLGRPCVLTSVQVREARRMIARGESVTHAARVLRCGRATLYRALGASGTLLQSSSLSRR
jgi:DNA invertase Pin-like site-specific DNA recombinase